VVEVVSGCFEICEEGKAYRAISVLDRFDLEVFNLDHLSVET